MAKRFQVFKCDICGSIVEVLHDADGDPVCCGQPMRLLAENSTDAAQEKHVPVIERRPDGVLVKVGSIAHPMEAEHYIEWIELIASAVGGGQSVSYRAYFRPGDKPEAFFPVSAPKVEAREYCNKHGLWKAQ